MRSFPIEHEVQIEIGEAEITCIINGSISTWDEHYGADADGHRGIDIIDQEIDEWTVVDLNQVEITDPEILKKVNDYYEKNLAAQDAVNAEEAHNEND